MFAIMGITGHVGGEVARNLLAARQPVRGIVRNVSRAQAWAELGCSLVSADINDSCSLATAFSGAQAVFILVPPNFDPSPDFSEAEAIASSLLAALDTARPPRAVYLCTIGADATHTNLLTQHTIIERALQKSPVPITFLRAAWFMENSSWDLPAAKNGLIPGFLQPLDKPVPMVAVADIGHVAAQLLQQSWTGHRIVELEGPRRVTPNDIAATFAKLLGHPVRTEIVPRATWESLFKSQGMNNPIPPIQMLDGFNQGWIEFKSGQSSSQRE
jgi:uncharacterized protein YbjT (DUF2867 family)